MRVTRRPPTRVFPRSVTRAAAWPRGVSGPAGGAHRAVDGGAPTPPDGEDLPHCPVEWDGAGTVSSLRTGAVPAATIAIRPGTTVLLTMDPGGRQRWSAAATNASNAQPVTTSNPVPPASPDDDCKLRLRELFAKHPSRVGKDEPVGWEVCFPLRVRLGRACADGSKVGTGRCGEHLARRALRKKGCAVRKNPSHRFDLLVCGDVEVEVRAKRRGLPALPRPNERTGILRHAAQGQSEALVARVDIEGRRLCLSRWVDGDRS